MKSIVIGLLLFTPVFVISLLTGLQKEWPFLFDPYSSVIARVVEVEPKFHKYFYYSYSISNREYQGIDFGSVQQVGTTLTIYYPHDKPWISRTDKPADGIGHIMLESSMGALYIALAGTLLMKLCWSAKRKSVKQEAYTENKPNKACRTNRP
jgi:hypothetical protein